jgi:hypothetical protein
VHPAKSRRDHPPASHSSPVENMSLSSLLILSL